MPIALIIVGTSLILALLRLLWAGTNAIAFAFTHPLCFLIKLMALAFRLLGAISLLLVLAMLLMFFFDNAAGKLHLGIEFWVFIAVAIIGSVIAQLLSRLELRMELHTINKRQRETENQIEQ
ncbi:hypothetical protein [Bifidobacterium tibiigranuli]|jgi:hypothetical protein|uniref:hypothetical protein n=1 Tax=Bifidobacterium tibiigranuli TaxID=2172043 RepID=UPI002354617D|nr:hypothetical protein [Bifidobacterium tibiigranuli]MCH3973706.1 hypothetical protein [Bifidobacterium tibiigranuli]